MATTAQQARQALAGLTTLARRDLAALWAALDGLTPQATRDALAELLPTLGDKYGDAAATLAADWYEELRDEAGAKGRFSAILAQPPNAERWASLAGWAVGPLFGATPDRVGALSLLAGGLQRVVADQHRDTIVQSANSDRTTIGYARHASANACAFCAMLATREIRYHSEKSASRVVGRGSPLSLNVQRRSWQNPAKGIKARGSRPLGEKYHDDCHCVAVPVWSEGYEEAPHVAAWRDAYKEAFAQVKPGTEHYTPELLSNMRQILGVN